MNALKTLIKISRPRFWLYLGGTYLVGYSIGVTEPDQFHRPEFLLHLLYFLIPANIFLYGINDLSDRDTDAHNAKKGDKEHRLQEKNKRLLILAVVISGLLGLALFAFSSSRFETFFLGGFLVLATLYSVKPMRLKARPILDFVSNILYALPGFLGYMQLRDNVPETLVFIALFSWPMAMHLFSAIPDIEADAKAGVKTTAVWLGKEKSLILCSALWAVFCISAILIGSYQPNIYCLFAYPLIPLYILINNETDIAKTYWSFPYINGFIGFLWFLAEFIRIYS